MTSEDIGRLERVMQTGFNTLADLIRETNTRLERVEERVGSLEEHAIETNVRLGRLEEHAIETNVRFGRLEEHAIETNVRFGRVEKRIDNILVFVGEDSRQMRREVDDLKVRVKKLEDAD